MLMKFNGGKGGGKIAGATRAGYGWVELGYARLYDNKLCCALQRRGSRYVLSISGIHGVEARVCIPFRRAPSTLDYLQYSLSLFCIIY